MTFFIYFSLIWEIVIFIGALIMFFLPGIIAKWASIFFFISEFPFLAGKQIVIVISDTLGVTYATFGIPLLYLSPALYFFAAFTFISVENLFDSVDRDMLGRKKAKKQ